LARLTDRDRLLCRVLHDHDVLSTEHVRDLAFPSLSTAQHRLVTLCRLGVLVRFRRHLAAGSEPYRYALGPVGAALVAAEDGVDPPRPSALRARTLALAQSRRLGHLLGVNGFFAALAAAARRLPDAGLEAWWSERRCAAEWGELVRPDGFGAWREGGRRVAFFFEHDTGTEALRRVADKLDGYADVAVAEGRALPVLFRFPTHRREAAARRVLLHPDVQVVTSSADALDGPAGAVWLPVAGDGPRRRLADLAAAGGHRDSREALR
jgi:hypothetical protein